LTAAQFPTSVRSIGSVAEHPTGPARSVFTVSPPPARDAASNRVGSLEAHRLVAFLNSAHLPDGDDRLADDRAGTWLERWLTDAGEVLREYAAKLLNLRNEAAGALTELRELHRGRLNLAANEYTCLYLLPLLDEFRRQNPRIKLAVQRTLARL
jgi:hypothetical protein